MIPSNFFCTTRPGKKFMSFYFPDIPKPSKEPIKDFDRLAYELVCWSHHRLIVPPGHANSGGPMTLPVFMAKWLKESFKPEVFESLLCVARKNIKSAGLAVLCMGFLAPDSPLWRDGFSIGVISINKKKTDELRKQVQAIARASGYANKESGFQFSVTQTYTPSVTVDYLSGTADAGHASGFDLVIVDELGLFRESDRELLAGAISSMSAKNGRLLAISIRGHSELLQEYIDRKDDPEVCVHLYEAAKNCDLFDVQQWHRANPTLGYIKSLDYMNRAAKKAARVPAGENHFRAHDLNQKVDAAAEAIITVAQYKKHVETRHDNLPPRGGRCWIGV